MQNAMIASVGAYLPEKVLPNSWFNDLLGEDVDTWLRENVHIYERRWAAEDESTADLAEKAAIQALERAGVSAEDVDLIVLSTDTPEYISPSTSVVVQDRIGAQKAGTFDINTACAGFVTALDIAAKYIRADEQYQNVLVIGAYAMSKFLNLQDKKTVTLFADGAGAFLLQAQPDMEKGFLASELRSMGQYAGWMGVYGGGTHHPVNGRSETAVQQLEFVKRFPKELNPVTWEDMARKLNSRLGVTSGDVDHYLLTQLNINTIWETLDLLGVPHEKAPTIMQHYGYTGSACLPLAFNDSWEKGLIKPGDLIYFIGSGGGLTFASAAFKF